MSTEATQTPSAATAVTNATAALAPIAGIALSTAQSIATDAAAVTQAGTTLLTAAPELISEVEPAIAELSALLKDAGQIPAVMSLFTSISSIFAKKAVTTGTAA